MDEPLFDDLRQLRRDHQRANDAFETQEAQVITFLRAKGYSWEEIGREIGITRQSAWKQYGRKVEE